MARYNYSKIRFHGDSLVHACTICIALTVVIVILLGNALDQHHQGRRFTNVVTGSANTTISSFSRGSKLNCTPPNIHLAPRSNVDVSLHRVNMTLSFTMPHECNPSKMSTLVTYGHHDHCDHHQVFQTIPDETLQFSFANYIRSYQSSWIYHVILPDLMAGGHQYWYQIATSDLKANALMTSSWQSSVFNFTTPPLPMDSISIALIADWGGSSEAIKTMQGMTTNNVSLVIIAGDVSYANARLPGWEEWLSAMQPLFAKIPLIVAAGNHEIECNRHNFQIFQAYEAYFRNPNRIAPPHIEVIPYQLSDCTHPAEFWTTYWYGNSFYSYRHGLLQIIVLNSYTDSSPSSVQYEWLQQELEHRVNRTLTPWLMVVFHCPFHTTFRGHNDEDNPRRMMASLEPLFVDHHVNIIVSGHNHAYVRTHPMVGNHMDDKGPLYLTMGTGGDSHAQGPLRPHANDTWVAHRDNTEYGFGQLHIVNTTHAYFQRILNHKNNTNHPEAMDAAWIRNNLLLGEGMEEPVSSFPNLVQK